MKKKILLTEQELEIIEMGRIYKNNFPNKDENKIRWHVEQCFYKWLDN